MISTLTSFLRARLRSAAGSIRSVWNWHVPAAGRRRRAVHLALGYLAALVIAVLLTRQLPSLGSFGSEAVLLLILLYTASYWEWPSTVFPLALALIISARMAVLLAPAGLTGFSRVLAIVFPVLAVIAATWSIARRRLRARRSYPTWRSLAEGDSSRSALPVAPKPNPLLDGLVKWGRGLLSAPGPGHATFPALALLVAGMLGLLIAGDGQLHLNVRSTLGSAGSDAAFVLSHLPWSAAKNLPILGTESPVLFRDRYAAYNPALSLGWEGLRDPCRLLADASSSQTLLECEGRSIPGTEGSPGEATNASPDRIAGGDAAVASAPDSAPLPASTGSSAAGDGSAPETVAAQTDAAPVTPSSPEAVAQNLSASGQRALGTIILARDPQISETLQRPGTTGQGGEERPAAVPAEGRASGSRSGAEKPETSGRTDPPVDKPQAPALVQTPTGVVPWPEGSPSVQPEPAEQPKLQEQPEVQEQPAPEVDLSQCPAGAQENNYPYGQCTWYVKTRRPDLPWFAGDTGDATNWADSAALCGYVVDEVPEVGAVIVWQAWTNGFSQYGHVGYVEEVGADYIVVSECNILYTNDTTWYEGYHACAFRYVPLSELDSATRFIHGRIGQ